MRILVTGSHGLVGSALLPALSAEGHEVVRLVRSPTPSSPSEIRWDPASNSIDAASLEKLDAAIHLAGENLASGRWTAERKTRIRNSRVAGTRLLAKTLAGLAQPPKVLLSASAVGYYGNRGDEILTEQSSPGTGFLADVCQEWEAAARPAAGAGIRVVLLRFGMILSGAGGALAKMVLPFRLGVGGPVGPGTQFWSWITIDDTVAAMGHALKSPELTGPVNVVSPEPITNRGFTEALGQALGRPTLLRAPAFALRIALGEMADEALLASVAAVPARLLGTRFQFRHPELRSALARLLAPATQPSVDRNLPVK